MSSSGRQPLEVREVVALVDLVDGAVLRVDARTLDVTIVGAGAGAGMRSLLGHPLDTTLSGDQFWGQSLRVEDREEVLATLAAVARDGAPRTLEHALLLGGRGELWFRTCVRRIGAPDRSELLLLMLDITNSRHDERQWREVEAWLVTLGETLPFDFWICDLDGRCVLQNPISLQHFGNLLGQKIEDVIPTPELKAQWVSSFRRALSGTTVREEVRYERGGALRTFARVVAPVRGQDGVQGTLGVDIDITDLKQTEERLRQSLRELGEAQETLVRRRQLAALGEMSAVVAHEVRNPLGSISNALALLRRRGTLQQEDDSLCEIIEHEVLRLDRLVAQLLDFVRPLNPKLSARAVEALVNEALTHTLRATDAVDRIRVVRVIDPALAPVVMDERLLGMALTNVFRNAVQAMAGAGELHIGIDQKDGWIQISIRDTGPGIPAEVRSRMFEPFITTRPTGTGLGLSIVRRVIDEHRGELYLGSEPGQGTTCVIRLPLSMPAERTG